MPSLSKTQLANILDVIGRIVELDISSPNGKLHYEAARIGGVTLPSIRARMLKLNAYSPAGFIDGSARVNRRG